MDTQKKARELMTKKRLHEHHQEENLLSLTEIDIQDHDTEEIEKKARELAAENRHHQHNLDDNMLVRSEEELDYNN